MHDAVPGRSVCATKPSLANCRRARVGPLLAITLLAMTMVGCGDDSTGPGSGGGEEEGNVRAVSAGQWHTCGVASGSAAYCWGDSPVQVVLPQ